MFHCVFVTVRLHRTDYSVDYSLTYLLAYLLTNVGGFCPGGVCVLGDVVRGHLSRERLSVEEGGGDSGAVVQEAFVLPSYCTALGCRIPLLLRMRIHLSFSSFRIRLTVHLLSLCCDGCKMLPSDRSSCSIIKFSDRHRGSACIRSKL